MIPSLLLGCFLFQRSEKTCRIWCIQTQFADINHRRFAVSSYDTMKNEYTKPHPSNILRKIQQVKGPKSLSRWCPLHEHWVHLSGCLPFLPHHPAPTAVCDSVARYLCILTPSFGHYWRLNGRICPFMHGTSQRSLFANTDKLCWDFFRTQPILWDHDGREISFGAAKYYSGILGG